VSASHVAAHDEPELLVLLGEYFTRNDFDERSASHAGLSRERVAQDVLNLIVNAQHARPELAFVGAPKKDS
jgi:hypothetical protein